MNITTIKLDSKNRMLRFGFGLNNGNWFIRIDLWFIAYRLNGKRNETNT